LAVGSLVGSIIANVCLALAVAALITRLRVDSRQRERRRRAPALADGWRVVFVSWVAMARGNVLGPWEAVLLLLAYATTLPFVNR
jgi:Ca2+/Na+ antiporter